MSLTHPAFLGTIYSFSQASFLCCLLDLDWSSPFLSQVSSPQKSPELTSGACLSVLLQNYIEVILLHFHLSLSTPPNSFMPVTITDTVTYLRSLAQCLAHLRRYKTCVCWIELVINILHQASKSFNEQWKINSSICIMFYFFIRDISYYNT